MVAPTKKSLARWLVAIAAGIAVLVYQPQWESTLIVWLVRGAVVWVAFTYTLNQFKSTPQPRRNTLRAAAWVLGIAALAAFAGGVMPIPEQLSLAGSVLLLVGVPVLAGIVAGLLSRNTGPAGPHPLSKPDLTLTEVSGWLKENIPGYLFALIFGGGGLFVWLYTAMKLGTLGILVGLLGFFAILGLGVLLFVCWEAHKQPKHQNSTQEQPKLDL